MAWDLNRVLGSGHNRSDECRAGSADIRAERQGQHLLQRDDVQRNKRRQRRRHDRARLHRDRHEHSVDDRQDRVHAQNLLRDLHKSGLLTVLANPPAGRKDKVVQNSDDPVESEAEEKPKLLDVAC